MDKDEIAQYLNQKAQKLKKNKEQETEEGFEPDMDEDVIEPGFLDRANMMDAPDEIDWQYEPENEGKKFRELYYVNEQRTELMNVTLASLENNDKVKNHIVVCGIHSAIKSFIMPLRMKYLKEYQIQKIVIITGEPDERGGEQIDSQIWNSISRFKHVYLVNGSPLKKSTLLKANINYADKVVILGHDSTLN